MHIGEYRYMYMNTGSIVYVCYATNYWVLAQFRRPYHIWFYNVLGRVSCVGMPSNISVLDL